MGDRRCRKHAFFNFFATHKMKSSGEIHDFFQLFFYVLNPSFAPLALTALGNLALMNLLNAPSPEKLGLVCR
jgi:hypothetical protein